MSTRHVLVTDYTWTSTDIEAEILARVGAELVVAETGAEEELVELVREAHGILTCFALVTPAVVRAGAQLQVIGRYGIGVDNIAVDVATELGILVTNVPSYCVDEVAEHVLALLLAHERGICLYDAAIRTGDWSLTPGLPIRRVSGRTLGIVGFGRIGKALATKARGLGLRVAIADPSASEGEIAQAEVERVGLLELAAQSDYVSIHAPLTPETHGLIGREFLAAMKPGAFLVNAARGSIVDQDALVEALREGRIAGAGLDVFEPERLPPDHALLAEPRVIATPHVAFYSEESVRELEARAAENVASVLDGRMPSSVVNPEVLELPRWRHLR